MRLWSKELILQLWGYNHFTLIMVTSLNLLIFQRIYNIFRSYKYVCHDVPTLMMIINENVVAKKLIVAIYILLLEQSIDF